MFEFIVGLVSLAALIAFFYIASKVGKLDKMEKLQRQQLNIQQHSFYFQIMPLDLPEDYINRLREQGLISNTMEKELIEKKSQSEGSTTAS